MLKIKKGLKKKGKGKKDKGEDLFDPEQLAKYKKELEESKREASSSAASASAVEPTQEDSANSGTREEDDEWKRFKQLTAGIDSTLKKTSGDLDRIKTSSYFQRKEPAAHVEHVAARDKDHWEGFEKNAEQDDAEPWGEAQPGNTDANDQWGTEQAAEPGPGNVEEPEEELVLEDELFDTTFVDAIASGQIKLAYIPDSPTEDPDGDDPFDTSAANDVVKKIAEEEKKEKRRVNLGSAVGFLTGKAEEEDRQKRLKSSAVASHRRRRPVNVNLLGDFEDDNFEGIPCETGTVEQSDIICSADTLDVQIDSETLTPSHDLSVTPTSEYPKKSNSNQIDVQELLREFETFGDSEPAPYPVNTNPVHDEEYFIVDEFAELATQSLSKSGHTTKEKEPEENAEPDPFDTSYATDILPSDEAGDCLSDRVLVASSSTSVPVTSGSVLVDPFDTSALKHLQPGSAELRLIEQELSTVDGKIPVRPPPPILLQKISKKPSEDDDFDFDPRKDEVPACQEEHPLDCVDGFGSDDITLRPQKEEVESEPDPFDTSNVPTVIVPGKTELRLLETELADLANPEIVCNVPCKIQLSDFEFNPRASENPDPFIVEDSDPFVVEDSDPFIVEDSDPFVVDHNITKHIPGDFTGDYHSTDIPLNPSPAVQLTAQPAASAPEVTHEDPFDTSAVRLNELYIGKKELQVLESELLNTHVDVLPPQNPLTSLKAIRSAKPTPIEIPEAAELHPLDHTDTEHSITPIQPLSPNQINGSGWDDPFDTSAAEAIVPSKLQVKLLEEELGVHSSPSRTLYDDPDFNPRETSSSAVHFNNCPLTPAAVSVQSKETEADPFDTSLADSLGPGKTELKVLEAELL